MEGQVGEVQDRGVIGKNLGWWVKNVGLHVILKITFYSYKHKHSIENKLMPISKNKKM